MPKEKKLFQMAVSSRNNSGFTLVEIIIARNSDYKIRINNIKRSGCHYVSWWLNKTWFNKIKLSLFIKIKKTIQK